VEKVHGGCNHHLQSDVVKYLFVLIHYILEQASGKVDGAIDFLSSCLIELWRWYQRRHCCHSAPTVIHEQQRTQQAAWGTLAWIAPLLQSEWPCTTAVVLLWSQLCSIHIEQAGNPTVRRSHVSPIMYILWKAPSISKTHADCCCRGAERRRVFWGNTRIS
jgi:hypothetical protein